MLTKGFGGTKKTLLQQLVSVFFSVFAMRSHPSSQHLVAHFFSILYDPNPHFSIEKRLHPAKCLLLA